MKINYPGPGTSSLDELIEIIARILWGARGVHLKTAYVKSQRNFCHADPDHPRPCPFSLWQVSRGGLGGSSSVLAFGMLESSTRHTAS